MAPRLGNPGPVRNRGLARTRGYRAAQWERRPRSSDVEPFPGSGCGPPSGSCRHLAPSLGPPSSRTYGRSVDAIAIVAQFTNLELDADFGVRDGSHFAADPIGPSRTDRRHKTNVHKAPSAHPMRAAPVLQQFAQIGQRYVAMGNGPAEARGLREFRIYVQRIAIAADRRPSVDDRLRHALLERWQDVSDRAMVDGRHVCLSPCRPKFRVDEVAVRKQVFAELSGGLRRDRTALSV